MKSRRLDLYFHAPCFDGIVSAVLCWDFFESRGEADEIRLHPVGYDRRERWLKEVLPAHSAVVDFLFHPSALFWADHHPTAFLTDAAHQVFNQRSSPFWLHDPKAKSCASLLRKELYRHYGYRNRRYDQLVDWAERIDSADYKNVRQALLAPTAALQVSMSLANASPEYCERLVRLLKRSPVSTVAKSREVQRRVRATKASLWDGLKEFAKASHLTDDQIVVFDLHANGTLVSRYAPYYVYPKARYSVGAMRTADGTKITAMRNPWRRFSSVPIGKIFARHGGGGHQRVGSLVLKGAAETGAAKLLTELVEEIRDSERALARDRA
jgi:hypothetical protein